MSIASPKRGLLSMLGTGAAVQAAMLVSMVAQNLLIPRILGIGEYGVVVGMLTPLNLLSGLAEPLFAALFLRYREDTSDVSAANLLRGLTLFGLSVPAVIIVALVFGLRAERIYRLSILDSFLIGIMAALFVVNAVLLAATLATLGGKRLAVCYIGQAVTTVCAIPLAIYFGVSGVLSLYVFNLFIITVILLLLNSSPRTFIFAAMRQARASAISVPLGATLRAFVAAVAPRSVIILLTVVSVLVVTVYMTPEDLAKYRIGITLLNAALYVIPISPPVLLEFFSDPDRRSGKHKYARNILLGVAIGGVVIGLSYIVFSQQIFAVIFGKTIPLDKRVYLLFLSTPFFILIPSFSTVFLSLRRDTVLINISLGTIAGFVAAIFLANVYAAFLVACMIFAVSSSLVMYCKTTGS